jgi:hypothetical protein
MAPGAEFGALLTVGMTLAGIVTMIRARALRRKGPAVPDRDQARRQAEALEMERRMASYLARHDRGDLAPTPDTEEPKETRA